MGRDFDVITPLLHEITYQAAAYDLLQIFNDQYTFSFENGPCCSLTLYIKFLHVQPWGKWSKRRQRSTSRTSCGFLTATSTSQMSWCLSNIIGVIPTHALDRDLPEKISDFSRQKRDSQAKNKVD